MKNRLIKNSKNYIIKNVSAVILIFLMSITTCFKPKIVYANGPKPANSLVFMVSNYPKEAVYVDLLIKMNASDKRYTVFNESMGKSYDIDKESEIVTYAKDGYLSYSFHISNASSNLRLEKDKHNIFANNLDDFNYIYDDCRYFKLVILDIDGNIINISDSCKLKGLIDSYLTEGVITYDVSQNHVENLRIHENILGNLPLLFLLFFLSWIAPLIITVKTETTIAKKFKLKEIGRIVQINIITNICLSIFIANLQDYGVSYVSAILVGEILVYIIEFLYLYTIYHHTESTRKIAKYNIIANTASLVVTLVFNNVVKYGLERVL